MDFGHGKDSISVGAAVPLGDNCKATTRWTIERWGTYDVDYLTRFLGRSPIGEDFHRFNIPSYRASEFVGNLITNAGWTRLMNLLTNQNATQALTATAVRIGVGNATTPAEAYTDTDLAASSGSSNRWFQPVTGVGTLGTRTLTFSASFDGTSANFAWNEFGLDVGTPTVIAGATVGTLLFNHKVGVAQGTKASGQVWTASAAITFA